MPEGARAQPERFDSLLAAAAHPARIAAAVRRILGETVEIGPMRAGPGGIARARAEGTVQQVTGSTVDGNPALVLLHAQVSLDIGATIGSQHLELDGHVTVPVELAFTLDEELVLHTDIRVLADDIDTEVHSPRASQRLLARLGNVHSQLREHSARYTEEVLARPQVHAWRRLNLHDVIDRAWASGSILPGLPVPQGSRDAQHTD